MLFERKVIVIHGKPLKRLAAETVAVHPMRRLPFGIMLWRLYFITRVTPFQRDFHQF
jgi:hypothetical protein